MPIASIHPDKNAISATIPLAQRVLHWMRWVWRPALSVVAVMLAALVAWHAFSGKNGVSIWQQKRAEDRELRKEIDDLNQENARLRNRIEQLKTNPDAIGIVAHDKLHYVKPNEVIVPLPPDQKTPAPPAATGK